MGWQAAQVANCEGVANSCRNPRFSLDNSRLYAKIMRVTIEHTGPDGGGTMGESWNQEIQISAFYFSHFCFPLFHLIPLPAPPGGGINPMHFRPQVLLQCCTVGRRSCGAVFFFPGNRVTARRSLALPGRDSQFCCLSAPASPGISYITKSLTITIPSRHQGFSHGFWLFLRNIVSSGCP